MDRTEIINQRAAESAEDFMEHGPRLWVGRQSYVIAKGEAGQTLCGGLGGMGIGRMWVQREYPEDETYADAPFAPETLDDFGYSGTAECRAELDRAIAKYQASRQTADPKPTASG